MASAKQGFWEAQWMLSMAYRLGIGVPRDMETSHLWYQAARKNGFQLAPEKSKDDFTLNFYDVEATEPGHQEYQQGLNHLMGIVNGEPDPSQAAMWFMQAAEMDHPDAEYKLGVLFFEGEGVEQNYSQSLTWFTKASESEHRGAQAYLAWMSSLGIGTPLDNAASLDWFLKSLQPSVSAQSSVKKPVIVPESFEWYEIAARKGDPKAQTIVALKYLKGEGVRANDRQGFLWMERAAKLKHPPAQYHLAMLYLEGKGVIQNQEAGLYWLNQAAIADNPEAQFELGLLYLQGKYVSQNYQYAYAWLNLAAAQDLTEAQAAKDLLMDSMSQEDLEQAQVLSREMFQKINNR